MMPLDTLPFLWIHMIQRNAATITLRASLEELFPTDESTAVQTPWTEDSLVDHQPTHDKRCAQISFEKEQHTSKWSRLSLWHIGHSSERSFTPLLLRLSLLKKWAFPTAKSVGNPSENEISDGFGCRKNPRRKIIFRRILNFQRKYPSEIRRIIFLNFF